MTTIDLSVPRLSYAVRDAIQDHAATCLQESICSLFDFGSIDQAREFLDSYHDDGTSIVELKTDEKLDLIYEWADDLGLTPTIADWGQITKLIDDTASFCLHSSAAHDAHSVLNDLEDLLDDKGLTVSAVRTGNPFACFRHFGERSEECWYVFEYRNLDGEGVHVDLYQYAGHLGSDIELYVEEPIPAGSFDPEIEHFDAA
ncbi:MAG: hypothetical protein AAGC60_17745 [Acidobacteriota bacterium]